jgi:hypothetical protein
MEIRILRHHKTVTLYMSEYDTIDCLKTKIQKTWPFRKSSQILKQIPPSSGALGQRDIPSYAYGTLGDNKITDVSFTLFSLQKSTNLLTSSSRGQVFVW